ncbi:MAG: lanthionine synthetase C family protein [Myxococcales bacterium]|nr:lanthionine synthetase C family protein [Myxococcales bacterium]
MPEHLSLFRPCSTPFHWAASTSIPSICVPGHTCFSSVSGSPLRSDRHRLEQSWLELCYPIRAMTWAVLLNDQHARAVCDELVAAVAKVPAVPGGLGGAAGHALLYTYAAMASPEGGDALMQAGSARLDAAVAALDGDVKTIGLWSGVAGVRFAIAHLADGDAAAAAIATIDAALVSVLERAPWPDTYDLISGLCGIGAAALEGPEPNHAILARVIDHLEALATREGGGVTWFTPPGLLPDWQRALHPGGYHNLGLAHGVAGVIALLAAALEHQVARARIEPLLRSAVAWTLAAVPARTPRRYPAWLAPETDRTPAKLGWCYGDPGMTVALWRAARALSDPTWEREAMAMAIAMSECTFEEAAVADTGLCHGAAGLAHIFNRLFQATGDERLGASARRWFERLLSMHRPGEGIGGFQTLQIHDGVDVWVDDPHMLSGAVGIALALLAATTAVEPAWDRTLLCDLAPKELA